MLPHAYGLPASIVLIVGGAIACFAGYRLFRVVLGIYGFILGAMIASSVMGSSNTMGMLVGAVVGGIVGAVILTMAYFVGIGLVGAGLGAWLGNRVHRAGDASKAEAKVALLENDTSALQAEKSTLSEQNSQLADGNQSLSAKLGDLSKKVESVQSAKGDAAEVLDGLQGDVLFRTGSAEITPDIAHQIQMLAQAAAKSRLESSLKRTLKLRE